VLTSRSRLLRVHAQAGDAPVSLSAALPLPLVGPIAMEQPSLVTLAEGSGPAVPASPEGLMLLWLIFALMTAAALSAVLAPLARPARKPEADLGSLEVYRHQLEEIEAERARGLVDDKEATGARIEISRRLLASADKAERNPPASALGEHRRGAVALATAIAIPLLTLALYLANGSPGLPSFPLAGRAQAPLEQAQIGDLVAKVEARLREHPEDGDGWDVIAPVYYKLGRFRDAADAYARAARLKGETVRRMAGFAESSVLAADGIVTEEARRAFERILALDPKRIEPRFWLALAKEQDGKLADALVEFKALLAEAPADAPWRGPVGDRVGELSRRLAGPGKPDPRGPGPSAEDVAAAEKLAPEDRAKMIEGMVEGLAQRLERDGRDLAGWQRLINAYAVLGRGQDARAALARARQNFPADEQALAALAHLAKTLGLGS
jgi:cytochrome c-type biogenesis protein CcmH